MLLRCAITVAVSSLLLAACGETVTAKRNVALTECRVPRVATAAQCATLEVPEDRSRPEGRKLGIFAAVFPANTASPAPDPLVILAGGPGQAASNLGFFAERLNEIRRTRDVVLIDQRGTGRSAPLTCKAFRPVEDDVFETDPLPRARACLDELKAAGVDPAQYTTTTWIADLEAMRAALGYAKWNLWGGSYGTRVAQEYVRRHPDRVRSITLDGVAPPAMIIPLDIWVSRQRAFEEILTACKASSACDKAHPELGTALRDIEASLGPDGRDMEIVDPATGERRTVRVSFDLVLAALQPLAYAAESAVLLPEMLARASRGEIAPLLAAFPTPSPTQPQAMNAALLFSVICAEDAPRITPEAMQKALSPLPTRTLAERTLSVCAVWPRGSAPPDFATPLSSDVPALLLSGGMDPVTPEAYGNEVAKTLPRSRHIVAPGYGHIVSMHACGPRLLAAFVADADTATLPVACVSHFKSSMPPPLWSNLLVPRR